MTPTRISGPITWLAVFLAVAQVLAPIVPFSGLGASPNESTTDLLITPAGWTFSIWSLIYLLSIVFAVAVAWKGATGTGSPRRLLIDLEVAFAGAAVWILMSAAEWTWATPIVLTVMTVALLDAARIAAGPADASVSRWLRVLTRVLVGVYAAWATAAVFQNWAAAIGADLADPRSLGWQLAVLVTCAVVGLAVTAAVGSVLVAYPLTLIWAFVGIIATAQGVTTAVVGVAVGTIVALVVTTTAVTVLRRRASAPTPAAAR
ncbi:MFS transporter [Gordonia sp. 'Campus']|uniref:MFS transporter n=1 Tax=Gordonia sp. 'Campus' TaxID=2915824 RepID=UPI001EE3E50D|nr:MFS transporter [Gordonia sp. 'Campus']